MKPIAKIAAFALLLALLLPGCTDKGSLVKLTYEDDRFVNKAASLSYNFAPLCYEPAAIGDPYAFCDDPAITLCEIPGLEPTAWLTEEYAGSATTVLYSEEITLPSLTEMASDTMYVCMAGERVFSLYTVDDEDLIERLTDAFADGEAVSLPHTEASVTYSLKFASEKKLPGLYYCLIYEEYAEGTYLSSQNGDRSVEIGELLNEIIDSASDGDTE